MSDLTNTLEENLSFHHILSFSEQKKNKLKGYYLTYLFINYFIIIKLFIFQESYNCDTVLKVNISKSRITRVSL